MFGSIASRSGTLSYCPLRMKMQKHYQKFKTNIFKNKDQLRESLKLLYSVDNLRPFIIEALTIIDRIETEKRNQKIKNNLIRLIKR